MSTCGSARTTTRCTVWHSRSTPRWTTPRKTSSGIESLTLNFDVTTVDAEAPDVSAPSSVGTPPEFQTALIGLLGKVMGGAAAG